MDAVYLYKHTASHELALSIKLLKKFYPDLGKIWIIGDKPPVAIQSEVNHIYHYTTLNKWADQFDKVRRAAQHPEVSDDFMIFNDDFYVTAPLKPAMYMHKSLPSLTALVSSRHIDPYGKSVIKTMEFLEENDLPQYNFELHIPMKVNKMLVNSLMSNITVGVDLQFRSIYGNSYLTNSDGTHYDVKNIKLEDITDFLSTSNVKFSNYRRYLEKLL